MAKAKANGRRWTRKEWRESGRINDVFLKEHGLPAPSQRVKVVRELQWLSHKFPWRSEEWLIIQKAAYKLSLLDLDPRRPRGRPRKNGAEEPVRMTMAMCLITGANPNFVARHMDPIFNPEKKGGEKNRVEYLAKKTRHGLAKLTEAEAEKLVERARRYWGLQE